ncbi:LacI family DNA-binding transcriptional regulator [Neptunicella sp. SCSIO 80796]|uniref:LacI family DNA-binding transcriptional regulator n=1 Tax=Neptunicella plasticusilytica TaxID=3117012 RepID=UPI003A4E2A20
MSSFNIQNIADKAGVCKATVSRVLNTPEIVSQRTRDKVMKVINQLGYTPNRLGASLRHGRSRNVAVMLPDITNPYFAPIVRAIEQIASVRGYSVIINDTQDNPKLERTFAQMVKNRQADGVITNSQRIPFDIDSKRSIAEQLPPMVNSSEFIECDDIYKVGVDNFAIGQTAAQHLLSLGHTHISAIAGPENLPSVMARKKGFETELEKAGLSLDPKYIYYGDYSSLSGEMGVKAIMQHRHRPTAIFCFGDLVAIGALHALRELEFVVPDDVSLISVDGIALSQYCAPPLTTVAQPMEAIGQHCITTLLDLIEGHQPEQKVRILPHKLIIRKSTAPVRK